MINNEKLHSSTFTASADPDTGYLSIRAAFYDQVKRRFLHQSAKYLRNSKAPGKSVPFAIQKNPV